MDQATNRCRYRGWYSDHELGVHVTYKCLRQAVTESGFCEFHDPDYWWVYEEEVRSKFEEMIKSAQEKPEKLLCIGFNLPSVKVRGVFKEPVYFSSAKFHHGADFSETEFHEKADFSETKFHEKADFSETKFHQLVNFYKAKFHHGANFSSAKFHHGANFYGAKFCRVVTFPVAKSYQLADFSNAEFHQLAYFSNAEFYEKACFRSAEFYRLADFSSAKFYRLANFRSAKFHHGADFYYTEFYEKADFRYAMFNGRTGFIGTRLIFSTDDYTKDKGIYDSLEYISFMGARFSKPSEVFFDHVYLGRVSFINCDIRRVNFRNVIWKKERGGRYVIFDEERRYVVFDEELLAIKANQKLREELEQRGLEKEVEEILEDPAITLDDVLSVYRRLRENYDYNMKYIESGRFFVSEMEVRRLYREVGAEVVYNNWFRRNFSITNFYKLLCLYGENHIWPIVWALIVVLTSTILRLFLLYLEFGSLDILYNINIILGAVEDSVRAFFQMGGVTGIDLAERLLSIPILGALMLSLRRKFERRFRH